MTADAESSAFADVPFKRCTCCHAKWQTREEFLRSPDTRLIGYQPKFDDLVLGLLLFEHAVCGTSFALSAGVFVDMYDGPIFEERLTGTGACPSHCLHIHDLRPCPARCACAYVREIMQIIRGYEAA